MQTVRLKSIRFKTKDNKKEEILSVITSMRYEFSKSCLGYKQIKMKNKIKRQNRNRLITETEMKDRCFLLNQIVTSPKALTSILGPSSNK